jgi:hypothetical protein
MMLDVITPCTMVGKTYSESEITTLIVLKLIKMTYNAENKQQLQHNMNVTRTHPLNLSLALTSHARCICETLWFTVLNSLFWVKPQSLTSEPKPAASTSTACDVHPQATLRTQYTWMHILSLQILRRC